MGDIEVTIDDLEKAHSQIEVYEALLAETNDMDLIAKIKQSIQEIKDEARTYDYILNPRPAPEICTLCNGHPKVDMPTKPCPWCGNTLVNAQPKAGLVHWKVPGEEKGIALPQGEKPE